MSERNRQFLGLYETYRHQDQQRFYEGRRQEFEAAHRQFIGLTTLLMVLTTAAAALAAGVGGAGLRPVWGLLAVIVPALSTALAAYDQLYAFERQAKLYRDAENALLRARVAAPDPGQETLDGAIGEYVSQVEAVFGKEQSQWGQLVKEIKLIEPSKAKAPAGK